MAFLLNEWYVAAMPGEISNSNILSRTVCGISMVFWRAPDGSVAALEDRCSHREMPLSMGMLDEGRLRCRYHGLCFASDGTCVEIPGQERIPRGLDIQPYPAVEKYGWVWVWPGERAGADVALVPEVYSNHDLPGMSLAFGALRSDCSYLLYTDNLLDLTHEPYIHPTTLGDQTLFKSAPAVAVEGDRVFVTRWMLDHEPAPFWRQMLERQNGYVGNCDRWQKISFTPPGHIALDIGVAPAGSGAQEGDRSKGVYTISNQSITPETETTCWNFWSVGSTFYDQKRAREVGAIVEGTILAEDLLAVEAVQRVMARHPGRVYASIATDAAGNAARRIVDRRLAAEAAKTEKVAAFAGAGSDR